MRELIERQAAIDALDKIFPADPMRNDYTQGITCGAALATEYIKQLPSAQPEPHEGHWIWVAGDLECSKCHTRYPDLYPDYDNSVACPHCGARMKGATT